MVLKGAGSNKQGVCKLNGDLPACLGGKQKASDLAQKLALAVEKAQTAQVNSILQDLVDSGAGIEWFKLKESNRMFYDYLWK